MRRSSCITCTATSLQVRLDITHHAHHAMLYANLPPFVLTQTNGCTDGASRTASTDVFFLECIPVPGNRFRPASKVAEQVFENQQTLMYNTILKACILLHERHTADSTDKDLHLERLNDSWIALQYEVNCLIDSTLNTKTPSKTRSPLLVWSLTLLPAPAPGIRQQLEKKEGLMRKHFMGKRVNFAARYTS